jgi:hypothetical protein
MSHFIIKTREKTLTDNGQQILYGLNKNKADIAKLRNFFSKRIYKNEGILEADAGIYTWILKKKGNFYAAKTYTKQEIGTLHINLKDLTNSLNGSDVYAAGELEILNDGTINFNLLSGSYMVPILKKEKTIEDKLNKRNEIVKYIKDLLDKRYGITANFIESDTSEEEKIGGKKILEGVEIKTSPENIEMLNALFKRVEGGYKGGYRRRLAHTYRKKRVVKFRKTRRAGKNLK